MTIPENLEGTICRSVPRRHRAECRRVLQAFMDTDHTDPVVGLAPEMNSLIQHCVNAGFIAGFVVAKAIQDAKKE